MFADSFPDAYPLIVVSIYSRSNLSVYHSPIGQRILLSAERRLFEESLGRMVDHLAIDDYEFGVQVFDELQRGQKLFPLYRAGRGLLHPDEPPPELTAFLEGAVATVYRHALVMERKNENRDLTDLTPCILLVDYAEGACEVGNKTRIVMSDSELSEVVRAEPRFANALELRVGALRRVAEYELDDAVNRRIRQLGERKEFLGQGEHAELMSLVKFSERRTQEKLDAQLALNRLAEILPELVMAIATSNSTSVKPRGRCM